MVLSLGPHDKMLAKAPSANAMPPILGTGCLVDFAFPWLVHDMEPTSQEPQGRNQGHAYEQRCYETEKELAIHDASYPPFHAPILPHSRGRG